MKLQLNSCLSRAFSPDPGRSCERAMKGNPLEFARVNWTDDPGQFRVIQPRGISPADFSPTPELSPTPADFASRWTVSRPIGDMLRNGKSQPCAPWKPRGADPCVSCRFRWGLTEEMAVGPQGSDKTYRHFAGGRAGGECATTAWTEGRALRWAGDKPNNSLPPISTGIEWNSGDYTTSTRTCSSQSGKLRSASQ